MALKFETAKLETVESATAKVELLDYLCGVAAKTEGADVWRALFAEMRLRLLLCGPIQSPALGEPVKR